VPVKIVRKNYLALVLALVALVPLTACGGSSDSTGPGGQRNAPSSILVLADSSLKDAFTQIGKQFEAQNAGSTVNFTYGSSSALSQQAVAGDPGDLLTTADQADMNSAEKVQLTSPKLFASKGSATYAIATLTQSKNTSLSQQFINYVVSDAGQKILLQDGFGPP
jgi:ABC-type molybdate transport system substrate-binding protein